MTSLAARPSAAPQSAVRDVPRPAPFGGEDVPAAGQHPLAICFTVTGIPVGQGELNHSPQGHAYYANGKRLKPWREAVAATAEAAMIGREITTGPVIISSVYTLRRARTCTDEYPVTKGGYGADLDHLDRAIDDALAGVVYADDAQVVDHWTGKRYPGLRGGMSEPGVRITVYGVDA